MTPRLASVIVPAFQAERFLEEALDSALAQDYPALEVIVVDDGSTDATPLVAARHPVRLLRCAHRGPAAARNTGVRAARGSYITILDSDDLWPGDRLSRQVAHLEAHPELGIVMGLTEFFVTAGDPVPAHFPRRRKGHLVPAVAGTALARREVFDEVGLFDESLWLCEDIDWLARAKDRGVRSDSLEQLMLRYRIHANNTSRDRPGVGSALLTVLRSSERRQRERSRD